MSVFDDEAKRLRRGAEIERAEHAIVEAADAWFDADKDCSWEDKSEALAAAVDAWRKLKGKG